MKLRLLRLLGLWLLQDLSLQLGQALLKLRLSRLLDLLLQCRLSGQSHQSRLERLEHPECLVGLLLL